MSTRRWCGEGDRSNMEDPRNWEPDLGKGEVVFSHTAEPQVDTQRRLRAYMVGENFLLHLFAMLPQMTNKKFVFVPCCPQIPSTAKVVSVHHIWDAKSFAFTCEDASFPVVPDGMMIPREWATEFDFQYVPIAQPGICSNTNKEEDRPIVHPRETYAEYLEEVRRIDAEREAAAQKPLVNDASVWEKKP